VNMINGYSRVTLMRGMPSRLREDVREWWKATDIDLPGSVYFTPLGEILDQQEGKKISNKAKVSNTGNLAKVHTTQPLYSEVHTYFKKEPPFPGAGLFQSCKVFRLGKTSHVMRQGQKWRVGSHADMFVVVRGTKEHRIVQIKELLVVTYPRGQFLLVQVSQYKVVGKPLLQVVTFSLEAPTHDVLVSFKDLIHMYAVVPHYDPVVNPTWNIGVIVS
jgi:hypothetical protein